jgi:hypothetical protein
MIVMSQGTPGGCDVEWMETTSEEGVEVLVGGDGWWQRNQSNESRSKYKRRHRLWIVKVAGMAGVQGCWLTDLWATHGLV